MSEIIIFILKTAWYFLPIGIANLMPVIFRRWFGFLALPLDGGRLFRGKPIFGPNKTLRGLFLASLGGTLIFIIQRHAFLHSDFFHYLSLINYEKTSLFIGTLMGLGAIFGDLVKSFIKRRMGILSGHSWVPFDQIDFTLGGILFSLPLFVPPWPILIFTPFLGLFLHFATNLIGKAIGLRQAAW